MQATILFFWLVAQGYLAPVQTQEFDDPKACAAALKQLQDAYAQSQGYAAATGICQPKAASTTSPSAAVTPSTPAQSCTFFNGKAYCQ